MAAKVDLEVLGVIENMSGFTAPDGQRFTIFGEGGGQTLADELDVPLLGKVPLEEALREHADAGDPLATSEPDAPASIAIRQAARGHHRLDARRAAADAGRRRRHAAPLRRRSAAPSFRSSRPEADRGGLGPLGPSRRSGSSAAEHRRARASSVDASPQTTIATAESRKPALVLVHGIPR